MSKKPKYFLIKDAVIRHIGTREDDAFCIFLPADPNFPKGIEARKEYVNKLTEATGIEHHVSKITDRVYFVARLTGVDKPWTFAHDYFEMLTNVARDSAEWQVSTIHVVPATETFELVSAAGRPFCMRRSGVKNAKIYPDNIKEWPDDDAMYDDSSDFDGDVLSTLRCPEPVNLFEIKKVIFSNPCTIVFWGDGTKTVVRCGENDEYDPEKGIAMALMRKVYGPRHHYLKTIGPYIDEYWQKKEMREQLANAVGSNRLNFADILKGASGLFTGKHIIDKVADKTGEQIEEENDED